MMSFLSTLPKQLPLDFLKVITDQFSRDRMITTGPYGPVYMGILPGGEIIAVNILPENSPLPEDKSFANEIQNIMAITHENLVRMVGWSCEGQQKVVHSDGIHHLVFMVETVFCYEYFPLGSIARNLWEVRTEMEWVTRFNIIKGICHGLRFLHNLDIVHLDLRTDNILLDENMVPKISNFGLARFLGHDLSQMNTQTYIMEYPYMAPDYRYRGDKSTKSDIYSLGLIILAITTGEANLPGNGPLALQYFQNVREIWKEQRIASKYPSLEADCLRQVKKCIDVALECVDSDRLKRPSIQTIIDSLNA